MRPDKVQRGIRNKLNPPPPSVADFEGDQQKGSAGYAFALYPTVEEVLRDRRERRVRKQIERYQGDPVSFILEQGKQLESRLHRPGGAARHVVVNEIDVTAVGDHFTAKVKP